MLIQFLAYEGWSKKCPNLEWGEVYCACIENSCYRFSNPKW